MKFKPNEIFKKYPDIEDIAIRLEESEKETREKNKGREKPEPAQNNEGVNKRTFLYFPEHAVISHFYKEGRWEQSPYTLKPGKEPFLKDLAKILESRSPDAIKVEVYAGKTRKTDPVYSKDIYFSENPPDTRSPENSELGTLVKKFDESLNDAKKHPETPAMQIELLRKDFESQLKDQEHRSEIKDLQHRHQREIGELQAAIREKDEYIDELEEELDENEGELNGFKEDAQKEKESPLGEIILSRVLVQAGENLLKQNPKIMKIGLGLSDDEIKKIFEKQPEQIGTGNSNEDKSSFSENKTADELSGLDEKHAQGIKDLIQFFKQIPVAEFKKLFTIDCMMQDPKTGMLNSELADKVLQFVNDNKPKD